MPSTRKAQSSSGSAGRAPMSADTSSVGDATRVCGLPSAYCPPQAHGFHSGSCP
ncbi:hypothetical protein QEG98_02905 [Myxococcus sp. MxC21-1]|uniref:hypothetical protein n=1 Tax=Myxococcus sp. MxC21-1 TaxID=3041439 RepID=UPI00292DFB3F|nr:hypothetical protein [Myxococcus sp. MxC21-1]WNZ62785.1 hypothetical protein QEG98_02905 [Myxococcus sp. MxC21-1]